MIVNQLESKIYACWLGKAIGGTLGGPFEGRMTPLALDFYDPVPDAPMPNDDLDLQVVWLHHLRSIKTRNVHPETLVQAWLNHVQFPFDEYGICLRNLSLGLGGIHVGGFDNWFGECMGAAIRSEIWACVAPGDPHRAAAFAWADAVCDHSGDGVWAEVFFAALQSMAFSGPDDPRVLLEQALALLPSISQIRNVVTDTVRLWDSCRKIEAVRDELIRLYGTRNFTDVKINIGFTILAWLAGEGDFGRSICIATNCGYDTDCTAATLGALLGILDPNGIPADWRRPIGEGVVLSPQICGITPPDSLGELTEWTLALRMQLKEASPDLGPVTPRTLQRAATDWISIPAEVACGNPDSLGELESLAWVPTLLHGYWFDLPPQAPVTGAVVRLRFQLRAETDLLVMAYHETANSKVWIDGRRLPSAKGDHSCFAFPSPSFHRAGRAGFRAGPLDGEPHDLVIAFAPSAHNVTDVVVGLGDATTFHWLAPQWHMPGVQKTIFH